MESGANVSFPIPKSHQSMLYLLKGSVHVNDTALLKLDENQLIQFNQDGEGITVKANEKSLLIFLSGKPLNEPVTSYGPYVMNTQTEILEAMRDYQMGKMGFLPVS
jgi:redox-sensitive bicupin YhaK (pirin superfamily)